MNVLVDTSVWSLALRRARPGPAPIVQELTELIREGRVVVIGPIRQELLSGVKSPTQFEALRETLSAYPDVGLISTDFEDAARIANRCRAAGIQGSNTDFLMCTVASRHDLSIYTTDDDFASFRRMVRFSLHAPRSR